MERETFEDFARRVGIDLEELRKEICEGHEEPEEEIEGTYYVEPQNASDFTCNRWNFLNPDLIPWYTSGFQ